MKKKKLRIAVSCALFMCIMFIQKELFGQIPRVGLIGEWKFTGNTNDSSGKGNHGTNNGASLTKDRFHQVNRAYSFDGNNNIHIGCGVSSLSLPEFTISCWFNIPVDNDGGRRTMIRNWMYGYTILTWYNKVLFDLHNSNTQTLDRFTTAKNYNDGKWHHIVMAVNNKFRKIYMDNILLDSTYTGYNNYYTNMCVTFGADTKTSALGFVGDLDDICFYDRVLSTKQVDSLFFDGTYYETLNYQAKDNFAKHVSLFPNPISGNLLFIKSEQVIDAVEVFNATGEKLITSFSECNFTTLNLSGISAGIYFVKVGNQSYKILKYE